MLWIACPSEKATRKDEVAWIIDRTRRNISNRTQTCIISTYRTIVKEDLSNLITEKSVLYAEIVHNVVSGSSGERIFEINDQILDISVFLSQLMQSAKKSRIPLDIILHNFSALIHNLGDEDMYRLVTYKAPEFNESANLILFIHPKSHIEWVWQKFKSLAREVIEIKGAKT